MKPALLGLLTVPILAAASSAQLMPASREAALRESLPRIEYPDAVIPDLERKIAEAVLYTEREIPPAMQAQRVGANVMHLESIHVTKNGNDARGLPTNPNRDFPWKNPGGTDHATNLKTFRFFWLPKRADGSPWPVAVYRAYLPKSRAVNMPPALGWKWVFPRGTLFGECLCMHFSDGYVYTFELRLREREINDWETVAYRPFPTRDDLLAAIKQENGPETLMVSLNSTPRLRPGILRNPHRRRTLDLHGAEYDLPDMPLPLVKRLLTAYPFRLATGEFVSDGRLACYAPTTRQRESIVPHRYLAGFIRPDRVSCNNCHRDNLTQASQIDPGRDWYEATRGCDGILSFHPFAPDSVGRFNSHSPPVRFNPALGNMVEGYDPAKHPSEMYQRTELYDPRPSDRPIPGLTIVGG